MPANPSQTYIFTPIDSSVRQRIFEAVGNIEIGDSVELSTEPGVMGRIGPLFPRTAVCRIRLFGPKDSSEARQDLAYLRSLFGTLFYIDARAAPPEKITWTMENLKAVDDNSAVNAFDVEVSCREIIGGEFGEFFPVDKLQTSTGLVPVAVPPAQAVITDVGNNVTIITMREARLQGPDELYQNQVAGRDIYDQNYLSNSYGINQVNYNAIAAVTNNHDGLASVLDETLRFALIQSQNHIRIWGSPLPPITGCTLHHLKFTVLGTDFLVDADDTNNLKMLTIKVNDGVYIATPNNPVLLDAAHLPEQFSSNQVKRADIKFPQNPKTYLLLFPNRVKESTGFLGLGHRDKTFSAGNFPDWNLLVVVTA